MSRVLRIALYHNLPSGGAKRAVYEWTRRLAEHHQLDVYTLSDANHDFCDIRPFTRQYRIFDFTPHQLFDSPFGRLNQWQRWRDLGDLTKLGRHIAAEINAHKYDIVFANPCLYTFIPTLLQFINLPAVYYLHEPFGPTFTRQIQRSYLKSNKWRDTLDRFDPLIKLYRHRLETIRYKGIKLTKRLLANSQFTCQEIKKAYGVDAPVCHYGVDVEKFRPLSLTRDENTILSVGELSPRKGFDFLVESLGRLPTDQRPRLRIASNSVIPPEEEYIRGLAARHGVELQILTNLNTEKLAVEYNKAQFCVYSPVMEPFGLVPLEAAACGAAVIGVREAGVLETVVDKRTGLLVERDPAQFAAAIQYLLTRPTLTEEYGRNGREHILANWTWESSVTQLENHLFACAEQKQHEQ